MGLAETHPTLSAYLGEYDAIEREWMDEMASRGIEFAPRGRDADAVAKSRARLAEKGARFLNGGASISVGRLSSACAACVGDRGSKTFYLSLACNRSCYFCFNRNQQHYERDLRLKEGWRQEVREYLDAPVAPTHAALTGGEPLLHKDEALSFFRAIHGERPEVHLRLYTAGDFLDEATALALRDAGLQELRLSVKLDEGEGAVEEALERLALARRAIPDVMVEMPVIPGTEEAMRKLLVGMDELGLFGINLLEFCYPFGDWTEFSKRGFAIKNPAFDVLYDYGYAGGLPVAGSELSCLRLLEFALDSGLSLGVHYCSLDNKNRDQILQLNLGCPVDRGLYQLDKGDYFYKTLKAFDGDVPVARARLARAGKRFVIDAQDGSLLTHPENRVLLNGLRVAESTNVAQQTSQGWCLRELKLRLVS